ncbi:uncharacterized protein PG998_011007 [Apiospora kogelbergensis]|uniref:uncharacterized protein n=1 Tax=Apiospora kogelbergensis TaxID=1337665 RepID=UPI00312E015A
MATTPSTPGAAAKTPNRRAQSADPNSARQSASARRGAATPHGRAAFAALQKRRTALFTPGKERRRSIRDQRETPRDPLRALSRLLAPSSQAIHSSSSPSDSGANSSLPVVAEEDESNDFDDDSDDFMIERPRLSLNLREDDDEDSELKPPRLSGLEDYTAQSIEMPRRAINPPEESTFAMPAVESSPAREPMFLEDSEQMEMDGPEGPDDEMDDENENEPRSQARGCGEEEAREKTSKHGIEYPSLPQGVVKRLATTFAKTAGMGKAKISPDTLDAIMQATDWFFEQLGDDLQAYANHAGRKTIDESDMIALMRRQRQTSSSTTPFALAQRHLPRELLQELRMPVPAPVKAPRKKSQKDVREDAEDDVT